MTPSERIDCFYKALQARDYTEMAKCYHPDAEFEDEVFSLKGRRIAAMWHMLCERGTDLTVGYRLNRADGNVVCATWEARYSFSATGRAVHNVIHSEFAFRDGVVITHRDRFDLWRWSRQALGATGLFLGWSPFLRSKIRRMGFVSLEKFITQHPEYCN